MPNFKQRSPIRFNHLLSCNWIYLKPCDNVELILLRKTVIQALSQNLESGCAKCRACSNKQFIRKYMKNKTIFLRKWLSLGCLDAHLVVRYGRKLHYFNFRPCHSGENIFSNYWSLAIAGFIIVDEKLILRVLNQLPSLSPSKELSYLASLCTLTTLIERHLLECYKIVLYIN